MIEKARRRMIEGINEVSGRSDCREAIALQARSWWVFVGGLVITFGVGIAITQLFDMGSVASAGVVGLLAGLMTTVTADNYWLGHCDHTVLLVNVNLMGTKATEVVAEYPYPMMASVDSGRMTKKVTVADRQYLMARQFDDRFRAITGIG